MHIFWTPFEPARCDFDHPNSSRLSEKIESIQYDIKLDKSGAVRELSIAKLHLANIKRPFLKDRI